MAYYVHIFMCGYYRSDLVRLLAKDIFVRKKLIIHIPEKVGVVFFKAPYR